MGGGEDEGTKEFDASDSKIRKLREQGNVPKSQEVGKLFSFIIAVFVLLAMMDFIWDNIRNMFYSLWGEMHLKNLTAIGAGFIFKHSYEVALMCSLPIMVIVSIVTILGDIVQVGPMLTMSNLGLKLEKLNPVTNIKNIFIKILYNENKIENKLA